jgi:hypothetical protein
MKNDERLNELRQETQCIHELKARGSAAFRPLQREQAHDFEV